MFRARRASQRKRQALAGMPVVMAAWPFEDPPDTGCIASSGLMTGRAVVESVLHEHDGDWVVLDDTEPAPENLMLVCLRDVVERHPGVGALGKLPVGWRADMDFAVPEWVVSPLEFEEQ